jgi:putative Mg2+ transporter-C (MgtC) family protein
MSLSEQLWALLYVGIAAVLGGVIGLEREWSGKSAGLRTHMLVAAAAALLIGLGQGLVESYSRDMDGVHDAIRTDPIRIVEAVIVGISFLGGGTIIVNRRDSRIEGLTTAASILMVAAIGITVGMRAIWLAVGVTALLLLVLVALGALERTSPINTKPDDQSPG